MSMCIDLEDPIPINSDNNSPHNTDIDYHLYTDIGLNRNLFNHINKNINKLKIIILINFCITNSMIFYFINYK